VSVIRWSAGVFAALAVAALAPVAASAAPATAPPTVELSATTLVPGSFGKSQTVYLLGDKPFVLHDVKATIDTAGLNGTATAELIFGGSTCSTAGTLITCHFDTLASEDWINYAGITSLNIKPVKGAQAGARGAIVVNVTSREFPKALTRTAPVTVADGVVLATDETIISVDGKPGETIKNKLSVRNAGANTITGVQMFFYIDPWYTVAKKYSNCVYATGAAYCDFDMDLKPGVSYAITEPLGITIRPDIPAPSVIGPDFSWRTPADNEDDAALVRDGGGKHGTQGALGLVAKPAAQNKGLPQTDTTVADDTQAVIIGVKGNQTADVAAVGARVSGSVGSTVTAKVGAKNLGPAFVFGFPEPASVVTVTPPAGTTVVSVPDDCVKAGSAYTCTTAVMPFDPQTTVAWSFGLRVDTAGELTGKVVSKTAHDPKTANDIAALVVNPVGGTGGDTGGTGGGLAVTGAPAGFIAGAGALLLVGGAAAFVIVRRRRTRFVA
jgi:hypothetical protein